MNRKKKGGNNSLKPPALTKTAPTTTSSPAPASAMPVRVLPPLRPPVPPQNAPQPSKAVPQPARTTAQTPRPSVSPPKPPVPTMSAMRTAAHPTMSGPSQRRVFTRSDRVRAQWMDFEETWVKPHQDEVGKQLSMLLEAAEKNSRVKGKALNENKNRIVNSMQREFAMAARTEWDARLGKAGLQAEDWSDMTVEEMNAVEQVLWFEDADEDPGVFALSQRDSVAPTLSRKTAVESSPPLLSQSVNGRTAQAPPPPATHKAKVAEPPQASSWTSWMTAPFTRGVSVTEVPEDPPQKATPSSSWGAQKTAPIIEDLRTPHKVTSAPQPPPQASQPALRPAHPPTNAPRSVTPPAPVHGLLTYAVPISLTMASLDGAATLDPDFAALIDKLYVNSIRQFHIKAADADAELARQLRKPMPPAERQWTLRAHMMAMEQMARDIVERRDALVTEERRKRGFGDGGGGDPAPMTTKPFALQPPGAFPDEHIRVAPVPEPEHGPEPEPELEIEPDVDEVIEIPLKGKKGKKGKKAAEVKSTTNGRSTPTPAAAPATKAATPAVKTAPTAEKKTAAAVAAPAWGAKTSAPARPASPAPINTKIATTPAVNGRSTPAPAAMSPWEAAQAAKAAGTSKAPEINLPSPTNGMWAPPVARAMSNKNPYAPTRPSRLAHVSEPESPEPPSPPPTREPTGKDYVAWFAGSSSEDEEGADDAGLSEDEEGEEEEDSGGSAPGSSFSGGLLASLAGGSPWAFFGEGQQPQKERGRNASPARGRGANATPTPAMAAAGRFGGDGGMGPAMGMGGEWTRWRAGGPGMVPSGFVPGPSSYGAVPSGFGGGPSGAGRQWQSEEDDLENMLTLASKTLDRAATTSGGRGGGVNIDDAMAMYVTAQKARDTLATPVSGRAASAWRR